MKGLILAAGYGTRLYPLTLNVPKPLLKVGGKTIMTRLVNKVEAAAVCDGMYIVTNDKFYKVVSEWKGENKFRFPIEIINDKTMSNDDRLGAIGDIKLVLDQKKPEDDMLVMAGDNLFEFDILDFISFSASKKHVCIALFDVKDKALATKYGIVSLGEDNKVVAFQEKPQEPATTLASTGIYYLPKEKLAYFDEYMSTGNSKDAPGNFIKWIAEKDGVCGYVFSDGWYDIGDKVSLSKADEEYERKGI